MEHPEVVEYRINKIVPGPFVLTPKTNYTIAPERCDIGMTMNVQVKRREQQIELNPQIIFIDKTTNETLATYTAQFIFGIVNFEQVIRFADNAINIPNNLMLDCLSIVIGTTRGLLISETKGTYLQDILFPIYNIRDLLQQLLANSVPSSPVGS